jgi:hypothetical protein
MWRTVGRFTVSRESTELDFVVTATNSGVNIAQPVEYPVFLSPRICAFIEGVSFEQDPIQERDYSSHAGNC